MEQVADRERVRALEHVTCSYNIGGRNEALFRELLLHVAHLNELVKACSHMQEAKILRRERIQLKFDTDSHAQQFDATSARVLEKLRACSAMGSQWFSDSYSRGPGAPSLDVFHHPELAEPLYAPKKTSHLDSADEPDSPKQPTPDKPSALKPPTLIASGPRAGPATAALYAQVGKRQTEAEEDRLVADVFGLLQQKAFISDRYGAALSGYDKLELVLRVCERYQ